METDSNAPLAPGDAFLLGYLPHRVGAHVRALDILLDTRNGAEGELAARVEAHLGALPARGAEIVSCVWQVQNIVGSVLGVEPPPPPQTAAEQADFARAVDVAFQQSPAAGADACRTAYALGTRCGVAERMAAGAALQWALWAAAPGDAKLGERGTAMRDLLASFALSPGVASDCPTIRDEDAAVTRELEAAAAAAAGALDGAAAGTLAEIHARLGQRARALESAVRGTPRESVRAWREGRLAGGALLRRLVEHASWRVPCRIGPGGQPEPRVLAFDKRALLIFSDSPALAAAPAFLSTGRPEDELYLTLTGASLFRWLPNADVDVIVLDATDDPNAPTTINYPREMFARLRQVAEETALELAACDWSRLDPEALRAYSFWLLVSGGSVHNLVALDTYGRPFVGLFASEEALDAHLARATPEQARDAANWQRVLVPGSAIFPPTAALEVAGIALNPSGPGRTRFFNMRTVEMLAAV